MRTPMAKTSPSTNPRPLLPSLRSPSGSAWRSYIASYAQSNNSQQVGRLCMRVLDRTKRVLDLIYTPN